MQVLAYNNNNKLLLQKNQTFYRIYDNLGVI